jgi:hypothetical protein
VWTNPLHRTGFPGRSARSFLHTDRHPFGGPVIDRPEGADDAAVPGELKRRCDGGRLVAHVLARGVAGGQVGEAGSGQIKVRDRRDGQPGLPTLCGPRLGSFRKSSNGLYRLDTDQGSFAVKELNLVDRRWTSSRPRVSPHQVPMWPAHSRGRLGAGKPIRHKPVEAHVLFSGFED